MNFVFLSPHFPLNFYHFCNRLAEAGATVLGIADESYESMRPELRQSLTEYYRVRNMHNYDELLRAMGYFTHKYGKLNRIDSLNEYWLDLEARLRSDFNIPGLKVEHINRIRRKSEMKRIFQAAGLKPARGRVCHNRKDVEEFAAEVGFPLAAKPDTGVGAAQTYKIASKDDIEHYVATKPAVDYIVEEFIDAPIVTFDGLANAGGEIVYSSSLKYSKGVMQAVNEDTDIYYYVVRDIPPALERAGMATLKAFDVRERFFHFEYFEMPNGEIRPMEVNIRPPGGPTLDMVNFSNDFDVYRIWADMIVHGRSQRKPKAGFHVMYVGLKDRFHYAMDRHTVLQRYGPMVVNHERINDIFASALGNECYILRNPDLPPLLEAAETIQRRG